MQIAIALLAVLPGLAAKSTPWVYSTDDTVPEDTIRITTLGSGTPDVRRHQVMLRRSLLMTCPSKELPPASSSQRLVALLLARRQNGPCRSKYESHEIAKRLLGLIR